MSQHRWRVIKDRIPGPSTWLILEGNTLRGQTEDWHLAIHVAHTLASVNQGRR